MSAPGDAGKARIVLAKAMLRLQIRKMLLAKGYSTGPEGALASFERELDVANAAAARRMLAVAMSLPALPGSRAALGQAPEELPEKL